MPANHVCVTLHKSNKIYVTYLKFTAKHSYTKIFELHKIDKSGRHYEFCQSYNVTDHPDQFVFLSGSIRHPTETLTDDLKHFRSDNPSD